MAVQAKLEEFKLTGGKRPLPARLIEVPGSSKLGMKRAALASAVSNMFNQRI
jgi:hypothetical protein